MNNDTPLAKLHSMVHANTIIELSAPHRTNLDYQVRMAAYSVLVDMAHPTVKRLWRTLDAGEPRMGSVSSWIFAFIEVSGPWLNAQT